MPAALQATGPRKPRSLGIGEKSPSKSSPWASEAGSEPATSTGRSMLLTCASGRDENCGGKGTSHPSSPRVIPRSALPAERYGSPLGVVNDTPRQGPADCQLSTLA